MATSDLFIGYVRNVRASATAASVLAQRLAHAAPEDLTADERKALTRVRVCAQEVMDTRSERDRLAQPRLRPRLDAFIASWTAMDDALGATARIPRRVSPIGARAQALRGSLFPGGAGFVHWRATHAWAEGHRRVQRIADEELTTELIEVIGRAFLDAARLATDELADAIGTGKKPLETADARGLADALGRFSRAVGAYARLLVAHCDTDDDASMARLRAAVAPIDLHRARRRSSVTDVPDAPVELASSQPRSMPLAAPTTRDLMS
jgi:hypothetical protein